MLLNLFWKVPPTGWKLFLRFPNISKTYHVYVITLFKEPYCFSNITIHSITRCVRHSSRINVIKRFTLCPKRLKYNPEKTKGPKGVLSREFLFRAFVHQHKNTNKHLKNKCVFQCFSRVPTFRVQVGVLTWRAQIRDRVRVTSFNSESPLKKCIITKNRNLHMTNFYTAFYTMLWCVMLFFRKKCWSEYFTLTMVMICGVQTVKNAHEAPLNFVWKHFQTKKSQWMQTMHRDTYNSLTKFIC